MGWVKIDNTIGDHEKMLELTPEHYLAAVGFYVLAIAHCDAHRTDGRLTHRMLGRIASGLPYDVVLAELERVGLVDRHETGWEVRGYLEHQNSKAEIEARSAEARRKVSLRKDRQAATGGTTASNTDGSTDTDRQDTDVLDPDLPDRGASEPMDVWMSRATDARLNVISAGDLCAIYPHVIEQAVKDALKNAAAGKRIDNWSRYVEGICKQKQGAR